MPHLYADTPIIGGCFDIECKKRSIQLLEAFKKVIISDLTILELAPARQEMKNKINEFPASYVIHARSNEKVYALAEAYIKAGALTYRNYHDALHVTLATVYKAETLASWYFSHIINVERTVIFNAINSLMGYKHIDIKTPTLILKAINHETGKKIQCC